MDRAHRPGALGLITATFMLLAITAPVGAATTGQICGEVSAFTAPTLLADGSVTIDGTTEVIDSAATIDAGTVANLTAIAALGSFTCINVIADVGGAITDIGIAAQAELCGDVTVAAGVYSVDGTALTAETLALIAADAKLMAVLDAAANGAGSVCLDLAFDSAGLVTSMNADATLRLCGSVTLDADSATVAGVDVPLSLLSADAAAALQVAVDASVNACVDVTVTNTDVVSAAVDATVVVCGTVTLNADGSATVDGVTIPAALIEADLAAALGLAAAADGEACITVDAVSAGGETTVTVIVDISLCATVEAITATTITVGGVTFPTEADLTADVQVGDEICFELATNASGVIVVPDGTPVDGGGTPGGDVPELLPDTALAPATPGDSSASLLLVGLMAAMALAAVVAAGQGLRRRLGR